MPKNLQIYTLKRMFKAYNKNWEFKMDEIDWSLVDSTGELPENVEEWKKKFL